MYTEDVPLSLATYNVLDLFDPDPADPRGAAAMEEKLRYLAGKIDALDADVVGLQEIGSEALLTSLVGRLTRGRYTSVVGTPDARGIRCALLSRLPIREREVLTTPELPFPVFAVGDPPPFGARLPLRRGIVKATVDAGGELVTVFVVHFKSGRPAPQLDGSGAVVEPKTAADAMEGMIRSVVFRAAEALFVRRAVDAVYAAAPNPDAPPSVAVVGDFNDVPSSIVFRTVRGAQPAELFDATRSIPFERRHSLMHYGKTRAIDHVLVGAGLHARVIEARVMNEDLRDHDALREAGETHFYDSDHSPVVVRFG